MRKEILSGCIASGSMVGQKCCTVFHQRDFASTSSCTVLTSSFQMFFNHSISFHKLAVAFALLEFFSVCVSKRFQKSQQTRGYCSGLLYIRIQLCIQENLGNEQRNIFTSMVCSVLVKDMKRHRRKVSQEEYDRSRLVKTFFFFFLFLLLVHTKLSFPHSSCA